MAEDLFHSHSPSKLREKIAGLVLQDQRSLPPNAKILAAVAKMQGFDQWPGLVTHTELDNLISAGCTELNRGICGTRGVPALFYAKELVKGPMYPGTLAAFGAGIHLATTTPPNTTHWTNPRPDFPRASMTACKYACGDGNETGIILRCVLKSDAKILHAEQIKEIRRDNRNRAREAQLVDCGALAAALGFDGFICENLDETQTEKWYVVVNRTSLIFQNIAIQHGSKPVPPSP